MKMKFNKSIASIISITVISFSAKAEMKDISKFLETAMYENIEIEGISSTINNYSKNSLISLPRPSIGYMFESMPATAYSVETKNKYFTLKQELPNFVVQYNEYKTRDLDKNNNGIELLKKKLEIRKNLIENLYKYNLSKENLDLLNIQKQNLIETSRSLENSYAATNKSMQIEQMKIHLELASIESSLLETKFDFDESFINIMRNIKQNDFDISKFNIDKNIKIDLARNFENTSNSSPELIQKNNEIIKQELSLNSKKWNLAPDLEFNLKKQINDSFYSVEINAKIPLWFFTDDINQIKNEKSKLISEEKKQEQLTKDISLNISNLKNKIKVLLKQKDILELSIIPQLETAFNSSLANYKTDKSKLMEINELRLKLSESKINKNSKLQEIIKVTLELENMSGLAFSNLPNLGALK